MNLKIFFFRAIDPLVQILQKDAVARSAIEFRPNSGQPYSPRASSGPCGRASGQWQAQRANKPLKILTRPNKPAGGPDVGI